jgi:AcrR family transcriptional regulator
MGSTERRAREREAMRSRILSAARELFVRHGYEAITLRKVAESIEYSPANIYKYFRDKDDMVRALCRQDMAALMADLPPAARQLAPMECLRALCLRYVDMGLEQPNHYRLMFMTPLLSGADTAAGDPPVDPEPDAYRLFVSLVEACIGERPEAKRPEDAHWVAQTVWAGLHGVIALHIALGAEAGVAWHPVRARATFMCDLLLQALFGTTGTLPGPSQTDS